MPVEGLPFAALLLSALVLVPPRNAFAAGPACDRLSVDADGDVQERWPSLAESVRQNLEARGDVDPCARVRVAMDPGGTLRVKVVLLDGRVASRNVARPEDVLPTLEGLLVVPPEPPVIATSSPRDPSSLPERIPAPSTTPGTPELVAPRLLAEQPAKRPSAADTLKVELSVLSGMRSSGEQVGLGVGLVSLVDIEGFLVGVQGRADHYEGASPDRVNALALAPLVGYRFRLGSLSLDFVGGPALAVANVDASGDRPFASERPPVEQSAWTASRFFATTRLVFRARSTLRLFVAIDLEAGPDGGGLPQDDRPRLPGATLGLALGATVGTR